MTLAGQIVGDSEPDGGLPLFLLISAERPSTLQLAMEDSPQASNQNRQDMITAIRAGLSRDKRNSALVGAVLLGTSIALLGVYGLEDGAAFVALIFLFLFTTLANVVLGSQSQLKRVRILEAQASGEKQPAPKPRCDMGYHDRIGPIETDEGPGSFCCDCGTRFIESTSPGPFWSNWLRKPEEG